MEVGGDIVAVSRMLHESAGTREHPFKLHKKTVLTIQYAPFLFKLTVL